MPDELTTATIEPQGGPEVGTTTNVAPEKTDATEAVTNATAESVDDFLTRLRERDPMEVLKADPRLNGKIGELAEKQTKKALEAARKEWEAEQETRRAAEEREREQRRRDEELLRLADEDPVALAERVKNDKQRESEEKTKQADLQKQIKSIHDGIYGGINQQLIAIYNTLPENEQAAIDKRMFSAPDQGGIQEYFDALMAAKERVKISEAVEKELEKRKPAWLKEALSETNGKEPSPDISTGQAATGESDKDFLLAFAEGRSNDYARARRLNGH